MGWRSLLSVLAGLSLCAISARAAEKDEMLTSNESKRPAIDQALPEKIETATFALG